MVRCEILFILELLELISFFISIQWSDVKFYVIYLLYSCS